MYRSASVHLYCYIAIQLYCCLYEDHNYSVNGCGGSTVGGAKHVAQDCIVVCEGSTNFVGAENLSSTSSGGLTSLDALGKSALEQSLSTSVSNVQWSSRQQHTYVTTRQSGLCSVTLACILLLLLLMIRYDTVD